MHKYPKNTWKPSLALAGFLIYKSSRLRTFDPSGRHLSHAVQLCFPKLQAENSDRDSICLKIPQVCCLERRGPEARHEALHFVGLQPQYALVAVSKYPQDIHVQENVSLKRRFQACHAHSPRRPADPRAFEYSQIDVTPSKWDRGVIWKRVGVKEALFRTCTQVTYAGKLKEFKAVAYLSLNSVNMFTCP